ncbi:MAG: proline iminopeptidase-family hydrolase [Calditrichaeota bacterium]|nr:proline iminopeptidase-family hydrolase [Calditrichota bacterium]
MKILISLCLILLGCGSQLKPGEGYVQVTGGKIWYRILGEGKGHPLIVLHGGPGSRSCQDIPAYSLLGNERPVIVFDQLESGSSDHPNDTTLWVLPRFVEQVKLLKEALGIKKFHLLGSSWGGAVAIEYMLTQDVSDVLSVTFAAPLLSTPQWIKDSNVLLTRLSQPIQDTISKYELLKQYDAPSYLAATDTFYANFLSRKQWPKADVAECEGVPPFNTAIYEYMWGPTEFKSTGTLMDFDRVDQLPKLKLPVLFINGEYDEVLPETMYYYQALVPGSKVAIVPNAGHSKTIDNPEDYTASLSKFMLSIENEMK